jgi:hypothetical protein
MSDGLSVSFEVKVSVADKLQGRGATGTLSYSIITRSLLDGNSPSYHLCHVVRDATVEVDTFLQIRFTVTLVVCAEERGESESL